MNYDFNIGTIQSLKAGVSLDAWWKYMVEHGIIAAGFYGEAGDRGELLLRDTLAVGDWVFAYASEYGYVGVGLVGLPYVLHDQFSPFSHLSTHLHERKVQWIYCVSDLKDAVNAHSVDIHHPIQAMQSMDNDKVKKIINELIIKGPMR